MSTETRHRTFPVDGAGLGLRRPLLGSVADLAPGEIDFIEVAPENWIRVGGRLGRKFRACTERYPLVCHGLSLSLGGPAPLDLELLRDVRAFLDTHGARCYTEHLSFCGDHGQLYDLMPIPFTEEAVRYVGDRIRTTQELLDRRIGIEHVSYYAAPGQQMAEIDFINAVVEYADCDLLLDVNNIYVNSVNHGYDPIEFLERLPGDRSVYVHIAGHDDEADDLKLDTHGSAVIAPVWDLLRHAFDCFGPMPVLLERDFNFPPLPELLAELQCARQFQRFQWQAQE